MKKIFTLLAVLLSIQVYSQKEKGASAKSSDLNERPNLDKVQFHYLNLHPNFCENFKKIIDGGREQFNVLKGPKTTRQISGVNKSFFQSTIDLDKNHKAYIGESEQYPEFDLVLSDLRFKDKQMEQNFDTLVGLVKSCLDPAKWIIQLKDASNDVYLEGTDFKKLVCRENKAGMKMKFELFLYNNRVLGYWVVELHMDGIGKVPEKKAVDETSPK